MRGHGNHPTDGASPVATRAHDFEEDRQRKRERLEDGHLAGISLSPHPAIEHADGRKGVVRRDGPPARDCLGGDLRAHDLPEREREVRR